jgi:hypothetical protein
MKHLRERGIYVAPDGQRLVASSSRRTTADGRGILSQIGSNVSFYLFSNYHWAFHGRPDYEIAPEGELIAITRPAGWQLDELIDTNATAGVH